MIFLIEYDRDQGKLVNFSSFKDEEATVAKDQRLAREMWLNKMGLEREVVLLEARNEDALKRTHRRYFEDLKELLQTR